MAANCPYTEAAGPCHQHEEAEAEAGGDNDNEDMRVGVTHGLEEGQPDADWHRNDGE